MRHIIFDTTLRDGSSRGVVFSREGTKIKVLRRLDELGVDFIEANPRPTPRTWADAVRMQPNAAKRAHRGVRRVSAAWATRRGLIGA